MRVFDAAGHSLPATAVRYQRFSGANVSVSPAGVVTCEKRGDGRVRASLGTLSKALLIRCRPIDRFVKWYGMVSLVLGDSSQQLPFKAIGVDGTPEQILAGTATIRDSHVASLDGLRVTPVSVGSTIADVWVGGIVTMIPISVYRRVSNSEHLEPYDFFAVSPLRIRSGETLRWNLAPGKYFLSFRSDTITGDALTFTTPGLQCSPFGDAYGYFCEAQQGAAVVVSAPQATGSAVMPTGYLALRRQ
jgi:hypothetical protein